MFYKIILPALLLFSSCLAKECRDNSECGSEQVCAGVFKECYNKIPFGGECLYLEQCYEENTACLDSPSKKLTCVCSNPSWTHVKSGGCYEDKAFCRNDDDCADDNVCSGSKCVAREKKGLTAGQVTGIVLGVIFGIVGVVALGWYIKKKRFQSAYTT